MDITLQLFITALGTGGFTVMLFLLVKRIPKRNVRQIIDDSPQSADYNLVPVVPKERTQLLFNDVKRAEYIEKLDVVKQKNLFLHRDYHIRDLSNETGVPIHHLSYLINTQFNLHFQDYINAQRVEFLIAHFEMPEWQNLTLEGMAWEAGFKSRSTFFRAFLKHTGQSPSGYFQNAKTQSLQA